jgi:hypothetical protein
MVEGGSCDCDDWFVGGRRRRRVRYGKEDLPTGYGPDDLPDFCHDCGAGKGGCHHVFCDMEECPACHGQLLGCGCRLAHGRWDAVVGELRHGVGRLVDRMRSRGR